MTDENASLPALLPGKDEIDTALALAEHLSRASMVPKDYIGKPGNCLVAILGGRELGIPPLAAMQNGACINGRWKVFGDMVLALCQGNPDWVQESFEEELDGVGGTDESKLVARCRVGRRVRTQSGDVIVQTIERTFSWNDAIRARLSNKEGPWRQYPKRMLQMRARDLALRDLYADVLKGMATADRDDGEEIKQVTVSTSTPADTVPAEQPDTLTHGLDGQPDEEPKPPYEIRTTKKNPPHAGNRKLGMVWVLEPDGGAPETVHVWDGAEFQVCADMAHADRWARELLESESEIDAERKDAADAEMREAEREPDPTGASDTPDSPSPTSLEPPASSAASDSELEEFVPTLATLPDGRQVFFVQEPPEVGATGAKLSDVWVHSELGTTYVNGEDGGWATATDPEKENISMALAQTVINHARASGFTKDSMRDALATHLRVNITRLSLLSHSQLFRAVIHMTDSSPGDTLEGAL